MAVPLNCMLQVHYWSTRREMGEGRSAPLPVATVQVPGTVVQYLVHVGESTIIQYLV